MATKKDISHININLLELVTTKFTIVGTSPLIVHAWSHKAKQMMLDAQMGKAKKTKHEIKVPVNDFMDSIYWLTEQPEHGADDQSALDNYMEAISNGARFGFPIGGIKQSFITGAYRGGLDVKQTELRGSFRLNGDTDASTDDMAEIIFDELVMREDMVKVGGMSKSADIRYRGEFRGWKIPLTVTYNANGKYSLEQILNCVNAGGFVTGIGEWRPEKDGQFGMYKLM